MSGPVGFIPGIIVAGLMLWYGSEVVEGWIREQNIPSLVRSALIFDSTIEGACREAKPKLKQCIIEQLTKDSEAQSKKITDALAEAVLKKAREATIYIRS